MNKTYNARVLYRIHRVPAMSIKPWKIIAAFLLAAQFAAAQEYAPAALAINSTISSNSDVVDNPGGNYNQTTDILIKSTTTFQATQDGFVSTGTYTYTRTSGTTATLNYTSNYSEPGYTETETATVLITFDNYGGGTITSSGTYSGNSGGTPFNGSFTSTGTFTYNGPAISNVTDKSTNEDTPTPAIPFTIGDGETAAASLTVTRASSNTTLVPLANVVLGGSGNNRTVTITPVANLSGTSTITLTVSDGALTTTDTFVLTVNAVNDTPTITDVTDRSTNEDTATIAIPFTIGDVETAVGSLTVTRTSSNTTLVPLANVILGGSGASRTVTITPVANQSGTSLITLTVSDGSLTASDTFLLTVVAVNDAPTISDVTNKSTNEDTATTAIPFTIGDIDTDFASIILSAGSSNLTLIPLANIAFGGSGTSRTVTITPAANQTGTATITLTVSDGARTATDTFVLTVSAVNDAPTISDVADRSTTPGTSTGAIAFTIGDVETAAASLTVTRASSNTTLVPLANVVLGGSGANRTVTVTPVGSLTGTATITLTVSDGALTSSDTFVLTVGAANTAPTISSVANASIDKNTATSAIAFTVGDIETAAGSLTLSAASSNPTLVPVGNIVFGGGGAGRTVTITPAANQSGTATITLTVSDGSLTATTTFVLTVLNQESLSNWRQRYFSSQVNSGDGADLNDFDKDGLSNILEYALGSDPTDPASRNEPPVDTEDFGGQPYLTITIAKPPGIIGITYVVEVSDALGDWQSSPDFTTIITDDGTTLKVRANTPAIGGTGFIRLKVNAQ